MQPFHLAFPTTDLAATRAFLVDAIGAKVGREAARWVDFDLFGHQVTAHLVDHGEAAPTNPVDGHAVPAFHFGVVLEWSAWESLAERLRQRDVRFVIEPYVRWSTTWGSSRRSRPPSCRWARRSTWTARRFTSR